MNETTKLSINVAKEFSRTPGPRSRDEGDFSGQMFLEEILLPRFEEALKSSSTILVDLDGTAGYATSFLEAAFGELARRYSPEKVLKHIEFKSDDEPFLIDEIISYIKQAR